MEEYVVPTGITVGLTKNAMTAPGQGGSAVSLFVNEAYTLNVSAIILPPVGGATVTLSYSLSSAVVTLSPTSITWTYASPLQQGIVFSNWLATGGTPRHVALYPWHRTKLTAEQSKTLHETSNLHGLIQSGGVLTLLLGSAFLAVHFSASNQTWLSVFFSLAYGLQANFLINGMHELGHGFVFKSKHANAFFLRVVSFLSWLHPDMFFFRRIYGTIAIRKTRPTISKTQCRSGSDLLTF